ncbi:YkgJ family cysteine cluster protein [Desulfovulcanus sp.]
MLKEQYSAQSIYICAQCSQTYSTCCKIKKELQEYCFPLSELEIEKIRKKVKINDFYVQEKNSRNFIQKLISLLPEYRQRIIQIFPPHNIHYRLKTKDNGKCIFLTDNGCLLQKDIKPFYCQIYPFWIYNQKITYFENKYCLAQKKTKKIGHLLKLFSVSIESIEDNFNSIITSLGLVKDS